MPSAAGPTRVERWMLPGELARVAGSAPARTRPLPRRTARDWTVDSATFVACALVWLAEFENTVLNDAYALPEIIRLLDPVLGALLCVALWWRRRAPMALGLAAVTVGAVSNTGTGAIVVALFSLALHRGWRPAVMVALLGIATGLPYLILYFPNERGDDPASAALVLTLGLLLVVAVALAVRARRQLVLVLRERAEEQRRDYERRLEDSRRDERRRLAREMHDVLAHRISLLTVHAGALEYRAEAAERGDAAPLGAGEVRAAVGVMREAAGAAVDELREVLHLLRSPDGSRDTAAERQGTEPPRSGADALDVLLAEAAAGGQDVEASVEVDLSGLRVPVARTVHRLVQEGLTNARKHAPDAAVEVRVHPGPAAGGSGILVEVVNPVRPGHRAAPGSGVGLTGLAERVVQHGGTFTHGERDGRFALRAQLPVEP